MHPTPCCRSPAPALRPAMPVSRRHTQRTGETFWRIQRSLSVSPRSSAEHPWQLKCLRTSRGGTDGQEPGKGDLGPCDESKAILHAWRQGSSRRWGIPGAMPSRNSPVPARVYMGQGGQTQPHTLCARRSRQARPGREWRTRGEGAKRMLWSLRAYPRSSTFLMWSCIVASVPMPAWPWKVANSTKRFTL